jgi:hypothetical protein
VQEPDRFGLVDPKPRTGGIGVRPLQSCAAAGDEVDGALRSGQEQQTPSDRGFGEVVMVATEDVADAGGVDIALDDQTRRQVKADAAPEYRCVPLLGVSVADPGNPDRADDDGPALLSPCRCSRQAENYGEAEKSGNHREHSSSLNARIAVRTAHRARFSHDSRYQPAWRDAHVAREKIFTPFFTTKVRGSGPGLPTVRRLIEAHQGTISIVCPSAGGTVVTVQLPGERLAVTM